MRDHHQHLGASFRVRHEAFGKEAQPFAVRERGLRINQDATEFHDGRDRFGRMRVDDARPLLRRDDGRIQNGGRHPSCPGSRSPNNVSSDGGGAAVLFLDCCATHSSASTVNFCCGCFSQFGQP